MKNKWYNIQNKAENAAEVYIFDEIGNYGVTAQDFISELKNLKDRPVNLRINSLGGDVFNGMAIYNVLKTKQLYI